MRSVDSILFASGQPIFPAGWGGAETSAHDLMLALSSSGVAVRALGAVPPGESSRVRQRLESYFERPVTEPYDVGYPAELAPHTEFARRLDACLAENRPDLVVTQAMAWPEVARAAHQHGVPSLLWVHGPEVLKIPLLEGGPGAVLYNSEFTRSWLMERFPHAGEVFYPAVDLARHRVHGPGARGALTLINPLPIKGGHLLQPLARALPDRQFLAVEGWVLPPFLARALAREPNVEVVPWQHDMRSVYRRTGVLLVPSSFEPFGRAPLEAAASGIPSISSGVGGLPEALGPGGVFVAPDAPIEAWVDAVRRLEDEAIYRTTSEQHAAWAARFDVAVQAPRFLELARRAIAEHGR